jgi:D-3-phosphoglycerate dehydrogenase / 2-oxoglutarate reductase
MIDLYISTWPFGKFNKKPEILLKKNKIKFKKNHLNRKLTPKELIKFGSNAKFLISDTELISKKTLKKFKNLQAISRVGIGYDNIDIESAKKFNICVCNTPDAPSKAVVDLTFGLMLNLLRSVSIADGFLKKKIWSRIYGKRLEHSTIGIIGCGRIGAGVIQKLLNYGVKKIYYNDHKPIKFKSKNTFTSSKKKIFSECDIVSIHIPFNDKTKNLIDKKYLSLMKKDSSLINTSRGGIVNEEDLYNFLKLNKIKSAALDVFSNEPYKGKISKLINCICSPHIGSLSFDCREKMELDAVKNIINFIKKKPTNKVN